MEKPQTPAEFFSAGWQAYRAIVEHDYLWHNLANHALRQEIDRRFGPQTPVSFLDLACGDAASTSRVLRERPLKRYVGVDQSEPALAAAAENVRRLGTEATLVTADFVEYLEATREQFDVIYIGLSAHHLGGPGLPRFFAAVRRCLTPKGILLAFEPFTLPDESRDDHVERLCAIIDHFWVKMTPDQRGQVAAHIRASDYPIAEAKWNSLAVAAGLSPAVVAMRTPDRISQLVAHTL
jgi:cyclopropane fatty-acyl-phospholipid synthase-like methyltransferase